MRQPETIWQTVVMKVIVSLVISKNTSYCLGSNPLLFIRTITVLSVGLSTRRYRYFVSYYFNIGGGGGRETTSNFYSLYFNSLKNIIAII